jgi:Protein of unknown function (DUF3159)
MTALPEPTWRMLLARGLPTFALEGFVPVLAFYAAWHAAGLGAGIAASTAVAALVVVVQLRRGCDVALAAVAGVFIAIQALVAIAAHSATIYLAQPVVLTAGWGIAYLTSAVIGRPLIGAFARGWYPFPREFRASQAYHREFGMQSIVWGVYCLATAALRLAVLLTRGIGSLVVVSFVTSTPILLVLVLWSVWHARRTFSATVELRYQQPMSIPTGEVGSMQLRR